MFFFKRRKKEKTLENKFDELNEGILNEKDRENPHKVEHYVIERTKTVCTECFKRADRRRKACVYECI